MEKHNKKLQIKTKTQVRPQMLIDEAYHKIKQMIFQRKLIANQRLIYNRSRRFSEDVKDSHHQRPQPLRAGRIYLIATFPWFYREAYQCPEGLGSFRAKSAAAQEHVRLLERMNKRDIPGSVKILRLHVQEARDHIISCLSKSEEPRDFLFDAI